MSDSHKYKRTDLIDEDRESRLISSMIKIALEDNSEGWKVDKNTPSLQTKKHPSTKRSIYRAIAANESTLTIQDRHKYWQCGYNHQADYNGFKISHHIDDNHDIWYAKSDSYGVVSARDSQLMLRRFIVPSYNTLTVDTYHVIGIITYEIQKNHKLYQPPTKNCIRVKQECSAEICYKRKNANKTQFTYVRIEHTAHSGGWMPNTFEDLSSINEARNFVNKFQDLNAQIPDVLKKRKLNEIKQMRSFLHGKTMSECKEDVEEPKKIHKHTVKIETKKEIEKESKKETENESKKESKKELPQQNSKHNWLSTYEQLLQMDFDDAAAMEAAQLFPNDLSQAIQMIINNIPDETPKDIQPEKEVPKQEILEHHDEEEKHVIDKQDNIFVNNENPDNTNNPNIMDTNRGGIEENFFVNDENPDITSNPNIMDTNGGDMEKETSTTTESNIYKQLIAMGFNRKQSIKAAELAPDNITDAINIAFETTDNEIKQDDNETKQDNTHTHNNDSINNENKQEILPEESIKNQFINFLKRVNMEKYLSQFEEMECCDMESIQYIDDDVLQNDIGIKNKILRKRFLGQCRTFEDDMKKFKNGYGINELLYHRLSKYGIVTIHILCDEIKNKNDLEYKYKITNNSQREMLWNLIQTSENDNTLQQEGFNV